MSPRRGGYRKPAKPAPVSGPGQLSRRTDSGQTPPRNTARTRTPLEGLRLAGSQSLQYGDVGAVQELGKGLPTPQAPAGAPPAVSPASARESLSGMKPGGSFVTRPTDFPSQDIMTGSGVATAARTPLPPRSVIEGLEYLIGTLDAPSQDLMDLYLELRARDAGP